MKIRRHLGFVLVFCIILFPVLCLRFVVLSWSALAPCVKSLPWPSLDFPLHVVSVCSSFCSPLSSGFGVMSMMLHNNVVAISVRVIVVIITTIIIISMIVNIMTLILTSSLDCDDFCCRSSREFQDHHPQFCCFVFLCSLLY